MPSSSTKILLEFLRHPVQTGTMVPSSTFLAEAMVEWLDLDGASSVLEYGAGTGPFTPHILKRMRKDSRFIAIERNANLAAELRSRMPNVTLVQDSVENVKAICDAARITNVDCIVSGLPWAAFGEDFQKRVLDAMMTVLRRDGQFVTFAYLHALPLPAARRFADLLPQYFREVGRSAPVWKNLPPALVYRCRR